MEAEQEDRDAPAQGREKFVWYSLMTFAVILLIGDIVLRLAADQGLLVYFMPAIPGPLLYLALMIVFLLGLARLKGWIQKGGDKGI
ncbi:MAG: hypothetical protein U5P41_00090 [Gammaproteobacteria bacterium]|nr:hypothetical protein [Gammaproteobacteria bacterium]